MVIGVVLQTFYGLRSYRAGSRPCPLLPMAALTSWLNSTPFEWQFRAPPDGLEAVREKLLSVLDDCDGCEADRVRWRLHMAERPQELWLLRDAVFQVVASQHCRAQAAERINDLVPAFQRVLPDRLLQRV